jgi:DNA-binding NarL/FixJ family response regulator
VINVLVVDDHPAVRVGLVALLRREPGIVPVAAAQGIEDALAFAGRSRPDIALVDYDLADGDGLTLCHRLKSRPAPPGVLIYSAFARDGLSLAARAAGADGLLSKGAPPQELFDAIRALASGRLPPPSVAPEEIAVAVERLDSADLPILGMLIERTPAEEIAAVLGLASKELDGQVRRIVARLATAARPGS